MPSCPKTLRKRYRLQRLRACMTYKKKQKWSKGAFSIIYVEISDYELRKVWRISKLKNKIWYFGHYRHIALLKKDKQTN